MFQNLTFATRRSLTRARMDDQSRVKDTAAIGTSPPGASRMPQGPTPRFKLVRYFTAGSLGILCLAMLVLAFREVEQARYFVRVQEAQVRFFDDAQTEFAKQQDEIARRDLLAIYESGNVNLARLFANILWAKEFAPFVARVAQIPVEQCRALPDTKDPAGKTVSTPEKKACYSEVGRKIMALPEFKGIDTKAFDSMQKTTVFKIKVYDTRGITAYSSEHAQVGADKIGNAGWQAAMGGEPASELTHRDTFNAFEGLVENRDLIESYLPAFGPGTDKIVGVFEIYSDVTPFLAQIKRTSAQIKQAAANQSKVEQVAAQSQQEAKQVAITGIIVLFILFALLFIALRLIVRRAASVIARQERDREYTQHQISQMVAGVAHQLNTPLAFSQSNLSLVMDRLGSIETPLRVASEFNRIVKSTPGDSVVIDVSRARKQIEEVKQVEASPEDVGTMREMLKDVLDGISQMSELVVHIKDFTAIDRSKVAETDINRGLRSVVYMAKSVIPNRINVVERYGEIPEITCQAWQLNQVFLNLVNNAAQAIADSGTITVSSSVEGDFVKIAVLDTGTGIRPEVLPRIFDAYYTTKAAGQGTGLGLAIARDVVRNHCGNIKVKTEVGKGTTFSVYLPATGRPALAMAA